MGSRVEGVSGIYVNHGLAAIKKSQPGLREAMGQSSPVMPS
jgi:hypothetical protein